MPATNAIRWKRVVVGGFLTELTLFAIVLPLNMMSQQATYYSVPLLVFVWGVMFGYWVARPVPDRFILHGVLTAVVASVIYIALTTSLRAPVPLLYHLSHGLRLLGGGFGGKLAERKASAAVVSETLPN